MKTRHGSTLLELALCIAMLTLLFGLGAPSYRHARDVLAVRAARDAIAASAVRTRSHAVGHGGANLQIDAAAGILRITTHDQAVSEAAELGSGLRVRLRLENTQATATTLAFDALGIGRIANRTISITRGSVTGGVTFSAYGRPRTW